MNSAEIAHNGPTPEGQDILACLRLLREQLELMTPANRQAARVALRHFIDNTDELLDVARVLQKLSDES